MSTMKIMKRLFRPFPSKFKLKVRAYVSRTQVGRSALSTYMSSSENKTIHETNDVFLISFPKCGRTWLKVMMTKALASHFGIEDVNTLNLPRMSRICPGIPKIRDSHEDSPHWKTPAQLSTTKEQFKGKKVIFLIRDIRDLVVSNYFQMSRRENGYSGDLSSFLHEQIGSVDTMIAYYNIWYANRDIPSGFLLVRYEDLHSCPQRELGKILSFIGIDNVSDEVINEAVQYASFGNMRRMEAENSFGSSAMRPGNPTDTESYKTRKGKVGGYIEYLSHEEIEILNQKISQLPEAFGYHGH